MTARRARTVQPPCSHQDAKMTGQPDDPEIPPELDVMLDRVLRSFEVLPPEEQKRLSERVREQKHQTRKKVNEIEFLLGRNLTRGERHWVHRRLHFGLRHPLDAVLEFDHEEELDAAYRQRLARSEDGWKGPLCDIPQEVQDEYERLKKEDEGK